MCHLGRDSEQNARRAPADKKYDTIVDHELSPKRMAKRKHAMVRVLSIPGRTHANRYFELLISELEKENVAFVPTTVSNLTLLNFDVLHLNFPTHYVTQYDPFRAFLFSVFFFVVFILARMSGRAVVYTVHDVTPPVVKNEWLLWPYLRLVHRMTDGYVFLSAWSRTALVNQYPSEAVKPWVLAPHGPYAVRLRGAAERAAAREHLGAHRAAFLVGFLGNIQEYKGLEAIRLLPESLRDGQSVQVVVAGRIYCDIEKANEIFRQMPQGHLIRLDTFPSDDELDLLMQTVDVVFLPYKRGSNSGAALRVLSNHTRIVSSDLTMFRELARGAGDKWVSIFRSDAAPGSPGDLAEIIERIAASEITLEGRASLQRFLGSLAFAPSASKIRDLYKQTLRR